MIYQYSFHEQAQKDYEESVKWYLERSVEAAGGFIAAVDVVLDKICTYPCFQGL